MESFQGSVAKCRILGGKGSLTEKIYTSSKNRNYIHQMLISLPYHWPSNNSISFKDIWAKTTKTDIILFYFRMFTRSFGPESKKIFNSLISRNILTILDHLRSPLRISVLFFLHLTPPRYSFSPSSYPITENEFGHNVSRIGWVM